MLVNDYIDKVVDKLKLSFKDYRTAERYVGQFSPEEDNKTTYNCPALFTGPVSVTPAAPNEAPWDAVIAFASVIVSNDIDPITRDVEGWDGAERLANALDTLAVITDEGVYQTDVPELDSITKVDRVGLPGENTGYTYWICRWHVRYRWHSNFADFS